MSVLRKIGSSILGLFKRLGKRLDQPAPDLDSERSRRGSSYGRQGF